MNGMIGLKCNRVLWTAHIIYAGIQVPNMPWPVTSDLNLLRQFALWYILTRSSTLFSMILIKCGQMRKLNYNFMNVHWNCGQSADLVYFRRISTVQILRNIRTLLILTHTSHTCLLILKANLTFFNTS